MKKKAFVKKIVPIMLILSLMTSGLAGCGKSADSGSDDDAIEITVDKSGDSADADTGSSITGQAVDVDSNIYGLVAGTQTVRDIKEKYGTEDEVSFRPFYNVDKATNFGIHFKCKTLDHFKAVTVHTDSKCEINSTVMSYNHGYLVDDGFEVVVAPWVGSPLRTDEDREKETDADTATWGNAPVYYLAIWYDMDAETEVKLDEPIVIPFTIAREVSTPNVTASINSDGMFELSWKPIDGAVSYEIYDAFFWDYSDDNVLSNYTRAEVAYSGDFPEYVASTSETTYNDFGVYRSSANGEISYQNDEIVNSQFMVRAVDAAGNKSQFSMVIPTWKYASQIPSSLDGSAAFGLTIDDGFRLNNSFPDTVAVTMNDKSTMDFPVNFKLIDDEYIHLDGDWSSATYSYEIPGTLLTGHIEYHSDTMDYPDEHISSYQIRSGALSIENGIDIIPSSESWSAMGNSGDSRIEIENKIEYPSTCNVGTDKDAFYERIEMENCKILSNGVYTTDKKPNDLDYRATGTNAVNYDTGRTINHSGKTTSTSASTPETPDEPDEPTVTEPETPETPDEPDEPTVVEPETPETPDEPTVTEPETPEVTTETPDNPFGGKDTDEIVDDGDTNEVPVINAIVFADSAEEEYLATMMIACADVIDLSAFPGLMNNEHLQDVLVKVYYQNPYILSFDCGDTAIGYTEDGIPVVLPAYYLPKEEIYWRQQAIYTESNKIISEIIDDGMTDTEKVLAIWDYLEQNTKYNTEAIVALDEGMESGKYRYEIDVQFDYPDTWNTYGILCDKLGVCQSYSYTFKLLSTLAGLNCVSVTGTMDGGGHAWNAVELDGEWYWVDTTNNASVGIPYWICLSSSEYAAACGFVADDMWDLDTNLTYVDSSNNSLDYWYQNGSFALSESDFTSAAVAAYDNGNGIVNVTDGVDGIMVKSEIRTLPDNAINSMGTALVDAGMSQDKLSGAGILYSSGIWYILFRE